MGRKFLLIDLQKKFKLSEDYQDKVKSFLNSLEDKDKITFIATKHIDTDTDNSLLEWVEEFNPIVVNKTGHSIGDKWLETLFENDSSIEILGTDLDACVYSIALQLKDRGISPKVYINYCNCKEIFREVFTKALKRNIGKDNVLWD